MISLLQQKWHTIQQRIARSCSHSPLYLCETNMHSSYMYLMYGKYMLFYESPKNWGYLRACANTVYQASPRGEGPGTRLILLLPPKLEASSLLQWRLQKILQTSVSLPETTGSPKLLHNPTSLMQIVTSGDCKCFCHNKKVQFHEARKMCHHSKSTLNSVLRRIWKWLFCSC